MKRVAIVGTGIAGMGAGYFLRRKYDVCFYEKEPRPGGHTNTVVVDEDGRKIAIDTGFIVYNELTYPNLTRFFKELEIPTQETSMSFSVQHVPLGLEYCGTGISGLFAQRKNIWNPRFLFLLYQINRFNKECVEVLTGARFSSYTLGNYVHEKKFGKDFLDLYLVPMSSAVWSMPPERMLDFPAAVLIRFFKNHGLLGLSTHLPWRTVAGGSRLYRDKVLGLFPDKVFLNQPACEVRRQGGRVSVKDARGEEKFYDAVILACHADEALRILKEPTTAETDLLSPFHYHTSRAVLHTDTSVMPKLREAWSSWNYRIEASASGELVPTTVYWMNGLQKVSERRDYFVSINDAGRVDPKTVLWQSDYAHPVFDLEAVTAQSDLPLLNQEGPVYFCGSYFRYGFHEDALSSALDAARALHGSEIWP